MKLVSSVVVSSLLALPLLLCAQQPAAPTQRVANPPAASATPQPANPAQRATGVAPTAANAPAAPAVPAQRVTNPPPTTPQVFAPGTGGKMPETITPTWETRTDYRTYYFEIPAPRGLITDRNGEPLAQSRLAYHLSLAFPTGAPMTDAQLVDYAKQNLALAADVLRRPVEITSAQLFDHYRERRILPMDLVTFLSPEEVDRIKPKLTGGLMLRPVYTRVYPQGKLAAHIIGYVGKTGKQAEGPIQNNEALWPQLEGRDGLEKIFNDKLTGKNGVLNMTFDAQGRKVSESVLQPPIPGDNVITTLDIKLQRDCEASLAAGCRRGAMVFLAPQTGDILAMASWPTYDPNMFVPTLSKAEFDRLDKDPDKPLIARAFRASYPAGSTYKLVISTAALQDGVIRKDEEINAPAAFQVGNVVMGNAKAKDFGMLNFDRAFTMSINTWFYQVGIRCGADRIIDWSKRFGFGRKTGVTLEDEDPGNLPTHEYMKRVHKRRLSEGDVANLSIGQGDLLVTPIQMVQAYCAIANGGTVLAMRLVQQIQNVENRVVAAYPPRAKSELGISESTRATIKEAMIHVVNGDAGTGHRAAVPGVIVAGKTGTAQWGGTEKHKEKQRYAAWFAGFAPAENPIYAFAAIYESEPGQTKIHGGHYAAPMIGRVLQANLKGVEKKKPGKAEPEEMPSEDDNQD
jgi:penicillin-binding protein 2